MCVCLYVCVFVCEFVCVCVTVCLCVCDCVCVLPVLTVLSLGSDGQAGVRVEWRV